ncbi:MAG: segregation/condensation protein A [Candidatus Paceibacterota bacterium]
MSSHFVVKSENFEGPLDLLLQLVERKKLHINEISLAKVADDYLNYLAGQHHLPKKDVADFLVIGSTLVFIKSLSLLPTLERTEEETGDIEELERRLVIYRRFKTLSEKIKHHFGRRPLFPRQEKRRMETIFAPGADVSMENIVQAGQKVIANLPKTEIRPQAVIRKTISLEAVIDHLTKRIQSSLRLKFKDLVDRERSEKIEVIVNFLGLLELVRQGILTADQNRPFADIEMETSQVGLPRYD